jgi:beta-glucosidase
MLLHMHVRVMEVATLEFPDGFLWGSAGAAHQTEGDNSNCDWWEHELAEDSPAAEPSGKACDSYNRFEEDWRLVADSGQNSVRFSVEWARIEPSPGKFSAREIDHYREVIGTAKDLGLTTSVTLHHFTSPLWLTREGGWERAESVEAFERYARLCGDAFGDLLDYVCTINEPQIVAVVGHLLGYFPPRKTAMEAAQKVTINLIKAHAAAVQGLRDTCEAKVGIALSINDYVPADDSEQAKSFRDFTHYSMAGVYYRALREGLITGLMGPDEKVPEIAGTDDYLGIQYYTKWVADPAMVPQSTSDSGSGSIRRGAEPDDRVTQMGWVWHPEGLGLVLDEAAEVGIPMIVTENGIATEDDEERIEYVGLHLAEVHKAIRERGCDVRGYYYWSYLDNFEWNEGYRPKFGLIECDRETLERRPKPSLKWYGSIASSNSVDL